MKKTFLAISALAAMLFAGCTSSDELTTLESIKTADNTPAPVQFGTYMSKTRAGYENTTGMTTDLLKDNGGTTNGFGVFAYYTGTSDYAQNTLPNFMYNQKVHFVSSNWKYEPLKYWPNEIQNGNVDDQTIEGAAQGSGTYGGKVSFFAYAPYIDVNQATATGNAGANPISPAVNYTNTTDGITNLSGNQYSGDPLVTYTIPSDINVGGAFVDLLWGTLSGTDVNVLGTTQNGKSYNGSGTTYEQAILNGYSVNADLTKQKVAGDVGFAFKHALAKIGGSGNGTTTGFLVKLDIDDGTNETGGSREQFTVSSANDAYRTIVTIRNITITNDPDNDGTEDTGETFLKGTGVLNLATGQWGSLSIPSAYTQTVGTTYSGYTPNAELSTKIAELYKNTSNSDAGETVISSYGTVTDYFKTPLTTVNTGGHPGVTETAQSIYNSASQSPIILIPGQTPKFTITVDYVVRTYDANLSASKPYSEVEQIITKTITFGSAVELNKHYTILMHLGLTGVKFTASVSNWETGYMFDTNGDSTPDSNQIDLPINVQ